MNHAVLLGEGVRAIRTQLGWSQEKLAEAAGLHRSYISQLERGHRNPTLDVLVRLASALDTKLSVLVAYCE